MTTQEIVKALRCCIEAKCHACPQKLTGGANCVDDTMQGAANLIEAQDELIKVLREQVERVRKE